MAKAAHILTDRQLKGALSSVKKKPKLPKNVLIRNEEDYWPTLNGTQRDIFVKLLTTLIEETNEPKHCLTIGLQSTLKHIKENQVKIVVLTSEFSPRMFAKHLLTTIVHQNQNMKVFILPKLKELTDKLIKAPTVIFAIKNEVEAPELESFYEQLSTHSELLRQYLPTKPIIDVSIKRKKKVKKMTETPVVLLQKIDESTRSFVPMETDSQPLTDETSQPSSDFISLSNPITPSSDFISLSKYSDPSTLLSDSSLPLYRPIKIMKVSGNPNRKLKKSRE